MVGGRQQRKRVASALAGAAAAFALLAASSAVAGAAAAASSQQFSYRSGELHGVYGVTVDRLSPTALRVRTEAFFTATRDGQLELFSGCYEIYCSFDRWDFLFKKGSNHLIFESVATGSSSEEGTGTGPGRGQGGGLPGIPENLIGALPILGPILDPVLGPIISPIINPILGSGASRRLTSRNARLRAAKRRTALRLAARKLAFLSLTAPRLLPVSCAETTLYEPGQALVAQVSKLCVP
jgi:hypothetical protein